VREHETLRANLLLKSGRDWLLLFFGPIPPACVSVSLRLFLQAFWQENEALDPIDVGFFGADRIMFGSDGVSDMVK
jgi:hypothetical protein